MLKNVQPYTNIDTPMIIAVKCHSAYISPGEGLLFICFQCLAASRLSRILARIYTLAELICSCKMEKPDPTDRSAKGEYNVNKFVVWYHGFKSRSDMVTCPICSVS
jgi:hypothetical protein